MPVLIRAVKTPREHTTTLINDYCTAFDKACNRVPSPDDPDIIHEIRVSGRRLRTLLTLYRAFFDSKILYHWHQRIRAYTGTLGIAREYDGILAFLQELSHKKKFSRYTQILKLYGRYFHAKKTDLYRQLPADTAAFKKERVTRRILRTYQGHCLQKQDSLHAQVQKSIRKSAKKILAHSLTRTATIPRNKKLHRFRIEIKNFRYTLEIGARFYPARYTETIAVCIKLQNILGQIQDFHVWKKRMGTASIVLGKKGYTTDKQALGYRELTACKKLFSSYFKKKRARLYKKALKYSGKLSGRIRSFI